MQFDSIQHNVEGDDAVVSIRVDGQLVEILRTSVVTGGEHIITHLGVEMRVEEAKINPPPLKGWDKFFHVTTGGNGRPHDGNCGAGGGTAFDSDGIGSN